MDGGFTDPPLHKVQCIRVLQRRIRTFPLVKREQKVYTGCIVYQIFTVGLV